MSHALIYVALRFGRKTHRLCYQSDVLAHSAPHLNHCQQCAHQPLNRH